MNIVEKLLNLENESRLLEPDLNSRLHLQKEVMKYSNDFINEIETIKAYVVSESKGKAIYDTPIGEPKPIEELLEVIRKNVDSPGLNPASGGHLGYIPGGGIFPSALGDYLADVFNRYAGMFFGSPGAVRMENQLLRWLCDMMGYSEKAAGNLSSGGSIANQIALCTARDTRNLKAAQVENSVIYTTAHVHHCVQKAINMVGLKEAVKRIVPMDDQFRMKVSVLAEMIEQDRQKGLNPFMVIASAGTTDVGAVDPLKEISEICNSNDIWFHVDAAYGGFFILAEETRHLFEGIQNADSIVIDPHKGMFLPYGTGAVLVKDGQKLFESQHLTASYLQDAYLDVEEVSPADLSPELTKHFRGLRFWLPLQLFGVKPFVAALSEKIWLCRYFYEEIKKLGFEVGPFPQLSVMTYRYIPEGQDVNEFNLKLVEAVKNDGSVFLSSTKIEGLVFLRIAILSFRTHLSTIDLCLKILKEKVNELQNITKNRTLC